MKKKSGIVLGIGILLVIVCFVIGNKEEHTNNIEKEDVGGDARVEESVVMENDSTYLK